MILLKNTKKGSYILEASISLPIFIIAILMIASSITIIGISENINYIACDEMERLQCEASYMQKDIGFKNRFLNRVNDEAGINDIKINTYLFRYRNGFDEDMIKLKYRANYHMNTILKLKENLVFSGTIVARGFTGKTQRKQSTDEEKFEKSEDYIEVFVFPESGTKYHKKSCTYVKSKPYEMILTENIKKKFSTCRICGSKHAKMGERVCCFRYGKSYHCFNCPTIKKYVISLEKDEAICRGYKPCSKCGGS